MKTIIKLFLLIVILHIFFAGCSDTSEDELDTAISKKDSSSSSSATEDISISSSASDNASVAFGQSISVPGDHQRYLFRDSHIFAEQSA